MEELIKSYGLNYKLFKVMLSSANGIIAGSSVLYEFLKASKYDFSEEKSSFGIKDFKPNDLDIWISDRDSCSDHHIIEAYFESLGYSKKNLERNNGIPFSIPRYDVQGISCVLEFKNSDKTIQIIYLDYISVIKFVSDFFDLSCCMVYWDPKKESITHLYPEATLKGRMKAFKKEDNLKVKQRINKYEERGFKLYRKLIEDVTFEEDSIYKDVVCHDVIGFEDIKIPQFIEKSKDGIVIKCGESYYGFEREYFLEYLRTHLDFSNFKNRFLSYSSEINSLISPMQIKFSQQAYFFMNKESDVLYEHVVLSEFRSTVNILKSKDKDRTKIVHNLNLGLDKDINKFISEINGIETKLLEERLKYIKSLNSKPQLELPQIVPVAAVQAAVQAAVALNQAPLGVGPLPPLPQLPF